MINHSINEIKKLLYSELNTEKYTLLEEHLEDIQILSDAKDKALKYNYDTVQYYIDIIDNSKVRSTEGTVFTQPTIEGCRTHKEIYEYLNLASNRVGQIIDGYHWREVCGLMKAMEDDNLIKVNWDKPKPLNGLPLIALEETIKRIGKDKPTRENRL